MLVFLDNITIKLGDERAFANTTWNIEAGQRWAVLGPSGAGKTVLAKALTHRLPLLHGQIHYFFDGPGGPGRPYLYPSEILTFSGETHREFLLRHAGYHQARWQSFEGTDEPTVASLLDINRQRTRSPFEIAPIAPAVDLRAETANLIDQLDLQPLMARQVHQLSHGESRKVFLARMLLRAPKLLILDDPFTGLDQATRTRLQAGVERLLERSDLSILFISAQPEELPGGVTHLLLVENCRVSAQHRREKAGSQMAVPQKPAGITRATPISAGPGAANELLTVYADGLARSAARGDDELICMKGVSVTYHDVTVLDHIDWTIRWGERWLLQGPNGAGKTTLLSLILGDNPQAYCNEITLFGQKRGSGESIWDIKRQIGWVSPELHAFYERSATTQEVVLSGFFDSIGLHRHSTPEQRVHSAEWLHALGMAGSLSQPFVTLSAGQQRLALLVRALVKQPPLLILDEPCQGLDPSQRSRFLGFVDQLCAHTSLALLYVTHDPTEMPAAITHHMRLWQGKVVYSGAVVDYLQASSTVQSTFQRAGS